MTGNVCGIIDVGLPQTPVQPVGAPLSVNEVHISVGLWVGDNVGLFVGLLSFSCGYCI